MKEQGNSGRILAREGKDVERHTPSVHAFLFSSGQYETSDNEEVVNSFSFPFPVPAQIQGNVMEWAG